MYLPRVRDRRPQCIRGERSCCGDPTLFWNFVDRYVTQFLFPRFASNVLVQRNVQLQNPRQSLGYHVIETVPSRPSNTHCLPEADGSRCMLYRPGKLLG